MIFSRRTVMRLAAAAASTAFAKRAACADGARVKAIAFDGFAIFDPRPVAALAERLFPGRGAELTAAWRTRQFEYTWLRSLTRRYADFEVVSDEALTFAAAQLKIDLVPDRRSQLTGQLLALEAWPDVKQHLVAIRQAGVKLALLTNFSPRMIAANIRHAGLDGLFDHSLSTDAVQVYKPDPRAYQMSLDAFGLAREEVLFVPSAGWDAAGALAFGHPTYWTNRTGLPAEELGQKPTAVATDLGGLATFLELPR